MCVGCLLDCCKIAVGFLSDCGRIYEGCMLDVCWINVGCRLDVMLADYWIRYALCLRLLGCMWGGFGLYI